MVKYNDKINLGGKDMSDDKTKKQILDEFWDISALVPARKPMRPSAKSVSTVEISDGTNGNDSAQNKLTEESTVIKRFIPPHSAAEFEIRREPEECYFPDNSLIHKVTLYKEPSSYEFYANFCATAKKLWNQKGEPSMYAEFFSYSPQYDQMNHWQLSYYLWWRENVRNGVYIKTNLCYIYLYAFELINASEREEAERSRELLINVGENYSDVIRGAMSRYIRWISDFSLINKLQPPKSFPEKLLVNAGAFKEYFVRIPGNTPEGWARALLAYCCSYDYRRSKFATKDNIALYDIHVHGALTEVVKKLSENGKILSGLPFGDCKISAKAYEGAVCSSANRYIIEAEYCSFSRSHELRFLVGDVVKYAENKIRAHISVKSRLTVYSLPNDLREVIDLYFVNNLPNVRRIVKKQSKPEEYEALYDLPRKKLDLHNADKIEQESWNTTKELVEAFEEERITEEIIPIETTQSTDDNISDEYGDLVSALGEYAEAVFSLKNGSSAPLYELSRNSGKPIEALVDAVNEISVEIIGDILIEENDGEYAVIEDYADMLN